MIDLVAGVGFNLIKTAGGLEASSLWRDLIQLVYVFVRLLW